MKRRLFPTLALGATACLFAVPAVAQESSLEGGVCRVSLEALDAAFAKAFDGAKLDLDRRVVLIHGTPNTLPKSVASLGPIPAQITLPIACGTIERGMKGETP